MAKRPAPVRAENERQRRARQHSRADQRQRRTGDTPSRARTGAARRPDRDRRPDRPGRDRRPDRPGRDRRQRPHRSAPQTGPIPSPVRGRGRPASSSAAKARAKARKAKAPKVVRPPLRVRLLTRLSSIDLDPRSWASRVPFVVLVIGSLGLGLGITLWLSTGAAERSYQLGAIRETNQTLLQQKEALEREVLESQAAPALAEAARELGMIPSRDTARLVQDPAGHWVVVGTPKPAEGVPPPPLNTPLPERTAAPMPPPPPAAETVDEREVPVRISPADGETRPHLPGPDVSPDAVALAVPGAEVPHGAAGQQPVPGPVQLPAAPGPELPAPPVPAAAAVGDHGQPAPPPDAQAHLDVQVHPEVQPDVAVPPPAEPFSPVDTQLEPTG